MRSLLLLSFALLSCSSKEEEAPAPLREFTYEIYKSGDMLGTLHVTPGEFGSFTPSSAPAAEKFRTLWEEKRAKGNLSIKMHMPSEDGERGPLGAKIYQPNVPGYEEGVQMFLMDKDYSYKELPKSAP